MSSGSKGEMKMKISSLFKEQIMKLYTGKKYSKKYPRSQKSSKCIRPVFSLVFKKKIQLQCCKTLKLTIIKTNSSGKRTGYRLVRNGQDVQESSGLLTICD